MPNDMKKNQYKSVDNLIDRVMGKTFRAYYHEMRRHEERLSRIFSKDPHHRHIPEETGSLNRVHPDQARIVTFWRCSVCMKDLTEKEVAKLKAKTR